LATLGDVSTIEEQLIERYVAGALDLSQVVTLLREYGAHLSDQMPPAWLDALLSEPTPPPLPRRR
jgi:hypothetical protein